MEDKEFGSRKTNGQGFGLVLTHHLTFNTMGLDCYPKYDRSTKKSHAIPVGFTHPKNAPCPFEADNVPRGILSGCCWLLGKVVVRELEALGEQDLAERMHEDMTAGEAVVFARELEGAALDLESTHVRAAEKPRGANWGGWVDWRTGEMTRERCSTFEEALAAVRTAARWYAKVGALGFGVVAWF